MFNYEFGIMKDELQTAGYEKDKKISKVLGWIIPAFLIGQAALMHFDLDEVLEIYRPVMWAVIGLVIAYQIYYLYKYRHKDDNKLRLGMVLFIVAAIIMLILFT